MTEATVPEQIGQLIDQYDLHVNGPHDWVRLDALEDQFPLMRRPIADLGIIGYVIPPAGRITSRNPAVITVDQRLTRQMERLIYAHEIGHALYGHEGAVTTDDVDDGYANRDERQAWEAAAKLLVPIEAVVFHQDKRRIASVCLVPEWLVEMAV